MVPELIVNFEQTKRGDGERERHGGWSVDGKDRKNGDDLAYNLDQAEANAKYFRVLLRQAKTAVAQARSKRIVCQELTPKRRPTLFLFSASDRPPGCLFLYPVRLAEVSSSKAIKSMSHPAPQYNTSSINL